MAGGSEEKHEAKQKIKVDLMIGRELLEQAARRVKVTDAEKLRD